MVGDAPVNPEGQTARDAKWAVGQLRHLYKQMAAGAIFDQAQAARGLLSPAIATLEALNDSNLAPAQPDARDAEIERLTCVNDGLRNAAAEEQECHDAAHHEAAIALERAEAAEAEVARLTKELEEARAALIDVLEGTEKVEKRLAEKEQELTVAWADCHDGNCHACSKCFDAAEAQAKVLREALEEARTELRNGFIACPQCGHEEPTSDLDVLTVYIEPALASPEPKAETPAETAGQKEGP